MNKYENDDEFDICADYDNDDKLAWNGVNDVDFDIGVDNNNDVKWAWNGYDDDDEWEWC